MLTTLDALLEGFTRTEGGWVYKFGDGYELFFEALLFGQMYVALYKDQQLLTEKVPVRPNLKQEIKDVS